MLNHDPPASQSRNHNAMSWEINSNREEYTMEALRREAHRLEADLEVKTQAYSRLSQRMNSDILYDAEDPVDGTQEQLLAGEIDQLLSALGECNERMGVQVAKGGRKADSAMLQRYREILFDFSTEFKKTSAALQRKRETTELFKSARPDRGGTGQGDYEQEHLLREQNAIHSSLQSATGVLGQAAEARESLRIQRATLGAASSTLLSMQNRFPAINKVVEAIQKKKAKDRLIIAFVIAGCVVFTLWFKGFLS